MPVSFILDFGSEDIVEELKKFMNFYLECCNPQETINPEEEKGKDETKRERSASKRRSMQN